MRYMFGFMMWHGNNTSKPTWQCILWCIHFSSVQLLSHVWLFATPWTTAHQASLFITNSQSPPNPCPLSQWCHPTISSSVVIIPFSSCPQSFPASGFFQMSQLFTSCGQSIGVSASTSVLPMNIQGWYIALTRWTFVGKVMSLFLICCLGWS